MRMPLLLVLTAGMLAGQDLNQARFARGDVPRWADPAFDDSAWEIVGERRIRPMEDAKQNRLWLRLRVAIPAEPSAVLVEKCPCEVFLDGMRLGGTGDLNAPRPKATGELTVFPVPSSLAGRLVLLAMRTYNPPGYEAARGPLGRCQMRVTPVREMGRQAAQLRNASQNPFLLRLFVLLVALGGLLAAAASQSRDPLILGMLSYVLSQLATVGVLVYEPFSLPDVAASLWLAATPLHVSLIFVQWKLAGLPIRPIWAAALAPLLLIRAPWAVGLFLAKPAPWTPLAASVFLVPDFAALGMALYAALRGWRGSSSRVQFLLVSLVSVLVFHWIAARGGVPGLAIGQGDTLAAFVLTVLATAHVMRDSRERRAEELRLRNEMESAQTVQALLLSATMPAGVNAVYVPASEVGGDFYQAFATPAGTLVLAGDVSGKGLQAAMRVSIIIGALRNRRSNEPAAVLAELNRMLLGGHGFTTCCCALFPIDGGPARVANAGHPAPYLDGREMDLEPALPLGVVAEATYTESTVSVSVLTFVSDGVLEAANAKGELFGFDRTREISTKSASEIAEAARAWGQNDDITVVTVRRQA